MMILMLLLIHCLLLLPLYVGGGGGGGGGIWSLFYNIIVSVLSNLAIISLRKREPFALLKPYTPCLRLLTPLKYHIFENIMKNGACWSKCSIFHNNF